ncbi:hypothetical protein X777_09922 [Ooceraea biroi]|uniref:Uncharacterized protein n=1 Tax=Ooceraea biroi TaxID=2015173 RepID=A0A026W589_OOCBI|nr:hypothetical protein X777_09922 [Ooceraea biroi]
MRIYLVILRKIMIRVEFLHVKIRLLSIGTHLENLLTAAILRILFLQVLMSCHYVLHQTGLVPSLVWTEVAFEFRINPTLEVILHVMITAITVVTDETTLTTTTSVLHYLSHIAKSIPYK